MYGQDVKMAERAQHAGQSAGRPPAPELQMQMESLDKALAFAEVQLSELESRLDGVLHPPVPEPVAGNTSGPITAGPSTRYGNMISEAGGRAYRIGARMQSLTSRVGA